MGKCFDTNVAASVGETTCQLHLLDDGVRQPPYMLQVLGARVVQRAIIIFIILSGAATQ